MSPAVVPIPAPLQEDEAPPRCMKCLGSDVAWRCKACQVYVHLRFSERGDYQLVRFSVNKALLSCANCVKNKDMDEERYELELAKVKDTLAKKESTVKQVEKDANSFGY